jgi:hypothetical protein
MAGLSFPEGGSVNLVVFMRGRGGLGFIGQKRPGGHATRHGSG